MYTCEAGDFAGGGEENFLRDRYKAIRRRSPRVAEGEIDCGKSLRRTGYTDTAL